MIVNDLARHIYTRLRCLGAGFKVDELQQLRVATDRRYDVMTTESGSTGPRTRVAGRNSGSQGLTRQHPHRLYILNQRKDTQHNLK